MKILMKNPIYMCCMLVFPLLTMLFFTMLLNEGVPQEMPVGVVDLDNTSTSRALVRRLDGFQSSRVVAHYASVAEARHAMQENEIYGFLYFPKGTTDNLLSARRPKISFYYSNISLAGGSMVMKDLKTVATLGSAAVGQATMRAKGFTPQQIQTFLQPIRIDLHQIANPWSNYNMYLSAVFVPGVMMLFMFLISAYSLGMELKFDRGKELIAKADGNIVVAILGKYLPQALVFLVLIFLYEFYIYHVLHFAHEGGVGSIVLLAVLQVFASIGFGIFIAHVDEYLFTVGCARLLAGRLRLPRDGYGYADTGAHVALPTAPLLYVVSDYGVQRLPAHRRVVPFLGPHRLHAAALVCHP